MWIAIPCLLAGLSIGAAGFDEERDAAAIVDGVKLLLEAQESLAEPPGLRAEWPYEGVYRVRGNAGAEIPLGYRIGGTALCATTLLLVPGFEADEARRAAVQRALEFVLAELKDPRMAAGFRTGYDVRGWGHATALEFLLAWRARLAPDAAERTRLDAAIRELLEVLCGDEIATVGGWNYSRRGAKPEPSTFMTATTLLILFQAKQAGFELDSDVIERALNSLSSARLESGAFQYAVAPKRATGEGFEALEGAAGRVCACEAALFLAGRSDAARVRAAVDAFFEHWEWLEKRRKQTGTHVPPFMIAPYYFFYAHETAALAIELLPEAERPERRARLRERIYQVREESGGWNDRVFPRSQSYGTAMVLRALLAPKHAKFASYQR